MKRNPNIVFLMSLILPVGYIMKILDVEGADVFIATSSLVFASISIFLVIAILGKPESGNPLTEKVNSLFYLSFLILLSVPASFALNLNFRFLLYYASQPVIALCFILAILQWYDVRKTSLAIRRNYLLNIVFPMVELIFFAIMIPGYFLQH